MGMHPVEEFPSDARPAPEPTPEEFAEQFEPDDEDFEVLIGQYQMQIQAAQANIRKMNARAEELEKQSGNYYSNDRKGMFTAEEIEILKEQRQNVVKAQAAKLEEVRKHANKLNPRGF